MGGSMEERERGREYVWEEMGERRREDSGREGGGSKRRKGEKRRGRNWRLSTITTMSYMSSVRNQLLLMFNC